MFHNASEISFKTLTTSRFFLNWEPFFSKRGGAVLLLLSSRTLLMRPLKETVGLSSTISKSTTSSAQVGSEKLGFPHRNQWQMLTNRCAHETDSPLLLYNQYRARLHTADTVTMADTWVNIGVGLKKVTCHVTWVGGTYEITDSCCQWFKIFFCNCIIWLSGKRIFLECFIMILLKIHAPEWH